MFDLMKLPYGKEDLAPYMSSNTLDFHHGKHLNTYVTTLNDLVSKDSSLQGKSIEELITLSHNNADKQAVFNNAGQVYNHEEFFKMLKKDTAIPAEVKSKIEADFGSFDAFKEAFTTGGKTQFGSGWVWLVMNNGKLEVRKYANAMNPVADKVHGVLTCDVWEHAYYLDYQNRRPDFLTTFVDHLVNWDYVAERIKLAK
ncbi:superoxide dismutase [Brachyspira hampsonii]|uniref:Superoxide dismutase n=1 Tax=Brachyspira hampsonii TaxID=1287055 RepID=A0AAC9XK95_9SPIR|nr:superoxide dismutase [Brachyspira hampsonii]ASJ21043.1 superoxide dismutase [Brachyspira hampsonii]ELV06265.1 superoxide dismutase [Brachyspira hampsonii 30599]MBW5380042.1 superoxide dismutase [Brachyspira hampsonii]MBW5409328.1 superoxide dismutase [Brachyspira hampsonii]OEJ16869.1 superoxide dismutase [Brachyspira hampsonii]